MSNINLEIPPDGSVPDTFVLSLNDRMRQIQSSLQSMPAAKAASKGTSSFITTNTTVVSGTLQGPHLGRLATNAAVLPTGTEFCETDRNSIYVVQQIGSSGGTWGFEAGFYADLFGNRPGDLGLYDDGFVFLATDRNALYIWTGSAWGGPYLAGATRGTLAQLPKGLNSGDAGYLYVVTTGTGGVKYNHVVQWTGTAWAPADGDQMGGYFCDYVKPPTEPGWNLADGTATTYLDIIAGVLTEVAITIPNLTTGAYRRSSTLLGYTGTVTAAAPILLGGSTSIVAAAGGVVVQSGTGAMAPGGTGTHAHSIAPGSSTATATLTGDPVANLQVLTYFRL